MIEHDAILDRLDRLEQQVAHQSRRARWWRNAAVVAVLALVLLPVDVGARKAKQSLELASADGRQQARITAKGFEYHFEGQARAKFDIGEGFDRFTLYRQDGSPSISMGTDDTGASVRVFGEEGDLRAEIAETVLDLGAGVRLFDQHGHPRALMYAGDHDATAGLRITDPDRQPRIEISATQEGEAMIRASDAEARAVAEMSVLHQSDASYRQLGFVQEREVDRLVPMVYMLDPTGTSKLIMPVTPH